MVFGRKKEEMHDAIMMNSEEDATLQQQEALQQQYNPMQQQKQQQAPQQLQQTQQQTQSTNVSQAIIMKARVTEHGTYKYVVETNYPLALGFCQLMQ